MARRWSLQSAASCNEASLASMTSRTLTPGIVSIKIKRPLSVG